MPSQTAWEHIPVRISRRPDRVTVAAPMPGLAPDDILVEVTASGRLALHGLWGTLGADEDGETILAEWGPGPYHRELDLPAPVDAERADLTYSRGVLVVTLPVAGQTRPARLAVPETGPSRAARRDTIGSARPDGAGAARRAMPDVSRSPENSVAAALPGEPSEKQTQEDSDD
jgi:HSP20 family protein